MWSLSSSNEIHSPNRRFVDRQRMCHIDRLSQSKRDEKRKAKKLESRGDGATKKFCLLWTYTRQPGPSILWLVIELTLDIFGLTRYVSDWDWGIPPDVQISITYDHPLKSRWSDWPHEPFVAIRFAWIAFGCHSYKLKINCECATKPVVVITSPKNFTYLRPAVQKTMIRSILWRCWRGPGVRFVAAVYATSQPTFMSTTSHSKVSGKIDQLGIVRPTGCALRRRQGSRPTPKY